MLKRRACLLASAAILGLAVSVPGIAAASAGAAAVAQPQASSAAVKDTPLRNAEPPGLYLKTNGHNAWVTVTSKGKSRISEVNCVDAPFPAGTKLACELENESGLCLDASTPYYPAITAESCVTNDHQEWWWRDLYADPDEYWMINSYWSEHYGRDYYMTAEGPISGEAVAIVPAGYGLLAVWAYP